MKAVMLVLTEDCNLACRYCYERGTAHAMSFAAAARILDRELTAEPSEEYKVFFFGGEPFVRFGLLRQIYAYTQKRYPGRVVKYAVTTNGTLVHGSIQDWLRERKDSFEITLSLDGTKEMHDRCRLNRAGQGSFDMLDLPFFTRTWPGCVAKMTISPATLPDFAEGIRFIEGMGFSCKANFASGADFRLHENRHVLRENFEQLVGYYTESGHPLCYMLDLPLRSVLVPPDSRFRYCQAGLDRHCYGGEADGEWYPCQGLMPMALKDRSREFRFRTFCEGGILKESPCRDCHFIRICRTCYAMNYNASGNVYSPDPQICTLHKMCMLVSARIQYNRLKSSGRSDSGLEKAIFMIARELNDIFD